MLRWKLRSDSGSAILEFIVFVLVGELFVLGGSIAISSQLYQKVELQSLAAVVARSVAKDLKAPLPAGVSMQEDSCSQRLVCIQLSHNSENVSAVSLR